METNKDMQELEQMREQMNKLKEKLDKQEIVNEQMLRYTMKSRMSWINKYRWLALLSIPFVSFCFLPMLFNGTISGWLYAFTVVMVAVSAIIDFIINRVSDHSIMNGNLLELSQKLVNMKRKRRIQTIVGMIVVCLWILWLLLEMRYSSSGSDPAFQEFTKAMMIGAGIGGLIGITVALIIYFKMQRTNDELIRQLDEMTQE